MNFVIGKTYVILNNDFSGHDFPVGEHVVFKGEQGMCNRFEYLDGSDYWYVCDGEVGEIE